MNYYLLPDLPYSAYESYLEKSGPSAFLNTRSSSPQKILSDVRESGLRG
jgi:hypothetical protein